jgi:glutaredoxin 3
MAHIKMYSTRVCPFCVAAEKLLKSLGHTVNEKILIDVDEERREEMMRITQRRTVPQIFINDRHLGGFDDLQALVKRGEFPSWIE